MSEENTQVEALEEDHETTAAVEVIEPPQSADQMDAVIAISKRIDEYARAHDMIVGAVVKRSYPGDWVVHKKEGESTADQKANMGAAAAERMAAFVGIQEKNWTEGKKEWSEDHKHFTWTYEADFTFGRRTIHVISRVGTRDKFFGKSKGQWKPLEDVQEDDIKKAAFRACRKEGVRTLLGLRNVPVAKLQELGFDEKKINIVGYEDKGKTLSDSETKAGEDGLVAKDIMVAKCVRNTGKTAKGIEWVRWDIFDKEGVKYAIFSPDNGKRLNAIQEACEKKVPVAIRFGVKKAGDKGQFTNYEILKVDGVEEGAQ